MFRPTMLAALPLAFLLLSGAAMGRPPVFETLDGFDPAASVRPSPELVGREWIENGRFERGLDDWRTVGEAAVQEEGAHDGLKCARLTNPNAPRGDARLATHVTVPGGAAYRSSLFLRSPQGVQTFRIKWEVYVGGEYFGGFRSEAFEVSEADGWTEVEFVQELPPVEEVRVGVLYRLWSGGPLLLDSASFQMIPDPPMYLYDLSEASRLAMGGNWAAWTAPFLTRVPTGFSLSPHGARAMRQGALQTALAGRETVTLPVFLSAFEGMEGVTVEVADARPEGRAFEVFVVKPFQYLGELRYDVLVPAAPFDMAPGTTRMVWVNATMPPGDARGDTEGVLRVSARGRPAVDIPFRLEAFGFDLPHFPTIPFCVGDPRPGRRVPPEERQAWRRGMAQRRMTTRHVAAPPLRFDGDEAAFDFAPFDEDVEQLLGMGMGLFQLPHIYVVQGHDKVFRQTFGALALDETSDEFRRKFVNAMRAFGEHLEQRGWMERFNHNVWDEPYARHSEQLREIAGLLKQAHPQFRPSAYVSAHAVEALIPGVVEEPITPASGVREDVFRRLRERGDIVSVYNPYHVFAANRRPELARGFLWWAWMSGFDRLYHWCIGPWRPTGDRPPGSAEGYGHCWVFENPGHYDFLPSVRIEAARAGSQDVDYLALYEAAVADALEMMGVEDADPRAFVRPLAEALAGGRYMRHSTDAALYERVRLFLGREIPRMVQPPLAVVSARRDGARLVVEVMAEEGARVEVHGATMSATPGARMQIQMPMPAGPAGEARVAVVSADGTRKVMEVPVP